MQTIYELNTKGKRIKTKPRKKVVRVGQVRDLTIRVKVQEVLFRYSLRLNLIKIKGLALFSLML